MPQDFLVGTWVESVSNHSTDGGSLACMIQEVHDRIQGEETGKVTTGRFL